MKKQSALPLAVEYDTRTHSLQLLDQRLLPNEWEVLNLTTSREVSAAIRNLVVRGAPAIGIAAAYGLAMAAQQGRYLPWERFTGMLQDAREELASARPTAANLFQALESVFSVLEENPGDSTKAADAMLKKAQELQREDHAISRAIGQHGASLLPEEGTVLTHCNAGALATSNPYGTALAPVYEGVREGKNISVLACETRPVLQGARLTAFELYKNEIPVTVICDNMAGAAFVLKKPVAVFVGCDRVAANGDMANKIGTYGLAVLAQYHGVPFYVCAPSTTIDSACRTGSDIPIEERPVSEISSQWYERNMVPQGAAIWNPAFDVTPAGLITAYITEKGIIKPPYTF